MKTTMQDFATGNTTTSTTGVSTVQGKYWLKDILESAKQRMYFLQFAYVTKVVPGNKDVVVPVPSTHLTFTKSSTESTARTMTQVDNMAVITFSPALARYGASISQEILRTSQVDYVKYTRDEMTYSVSLQMDQAFATAIAAVSSPAATLYGGDATSTATLESTDKMTPSLVAKALRYLKTNGWQPEPARPFIVFLSAAQEEALINDSQFINAAEYGSNRVIMNGEIGEYIGAQIISTEQVPAATTWGAGGNLAGHTCFVLKARIAYGIAWGEEPTYDYEYKKDECMHNMYINSSYQCKTLQEKAIVLVKVVD